MAHQEMLEVVLGANVGKFDRTEMLKSVAMVGRVQGVAVPRL